MTEVRRIESIARYVAMVSALVAASVGIAQFRRSVAQSVRELEMNVRILPGDVFESLDAWQRCVPSGSL